MKTIEYFMQVLSAQFVTFSKYAWEWPRASQIKLDDVKDMESSPFNLIEMLICPGWWPSAPGGALWAP